jgi:hypothetical protein
MDNNVLAWYYTEFFSHGIGRVNSWARTRNPRSSNVQKGRRS